MSYTCCIRRVGAAEASTAGLTWANDTNGPSSATSNSCNSLSIICSGSLSIDGGHR